MQQLDPADPRRVGPYTLLGRLGSGGMGSVFLGRSAGGRTVAVKLIRSELAHDDRFRARFRAEVAAVRSVSGAFTAPVVGADAMADQPWMATAFVPGISLRDAVAAAGPLPEQTLRALTAGIAEALVSIHAAGLTHRDLKPANVLLALDGPHVIDFGIARSAEGTALTTTGRILGTPSYMSPEQAQGGPLTSASDVFSLGSTIAFAACGTSLFGGGTGPEVLRRVVRAEPDLTGVPDVLRGIVAACLARNPADRPAPREVVEFVERRTGPATAGPWLPPVLISTIEEAASVIAPPRPPLAEAETQVLAPGGPPPDPHTKVMPPGPEDPPSPVPPPGPSRRTLLLGLTGGAVVLAGGGTALAFALRDDSPGTSDGKPANLRNPERPLHTDLVATPAWSRPVSEGLVQVTGEGDTVVAVSSENIRAFDRTTGRPVWGPSASRSETTRFGFGGNSVVVGNGRAYALDGTPTGEFPTVLKCVDLATGTVVWNLGRKGVALSGGLPGVLGGLVYVTGQMSGTGEAIGGEAFVWAVDPKVPKLRWERKFEGLGMGRSRLMVPSSGTRLLWATTDTVQTSPKISALDAGAGGKSLWQQPAPGGGQTESASLAYSLIPWYDGPHCWAAGHFLYLSDRLYAVDPSNGQDAWRSPGAEVFRAVVADPDGSTVYAAAPDFVGHLYVYAFDATSGAVRWAGSLAVAAGVGGLVAMQCADDHVYVWLKGRTWALSTSDGTARWTYEFDGNNVTDGETIPFWAGGGHVYGTTGKGLVALAATGGKRAPGGRT